MSRQRRALDPKEIPKKLIHAANDQERVELLQLLHERFWHAAPIDMIKPLTGMFLPRDTGPQVADVAKACETCNKWQQKLHKPHANAHYATQFNEIAQHDLFFLFGLIFMRLIGEYINYKMGDHILDIRGPAIVRALYKLWMRARGPSQNSLSDQEYGLLSNRLLVGTGGSTTKGLVEIRIATNHQDSTSQTMQR